MNKSYLIIFTVLLSLPVLLLATMIVYMCFKISRLAGFIALGVGLLVLVIAMIAVFVKVSKK